MAKAEIEIEILADGTISWKTDKIPAEHHDTADQLQKELEKAIGGEVKRTSRFAKARQAHHHDHDHIHQTEQRMAHL